MRAGILRKRVDIEKATITTDAFGGVVHTWAAVAADLPAAVIPLRGKELNRNQQTTAILSHRVTVRYSADLAAIDSAHRIKYGARYFDVKYVQNVGRKFRELILNCVENVTYPAEIVAPAEAMAGLFGGAPFVVTGLVNNVQIDGIV